MAKVQVYVGNQSPSIRDQLTVEGVPYPIPGGSTVSFSMRPVTSSTPVLDGVPAVVEDGAVGIIRYDPGLADFSLPGEYVGWWRLTLPSGKTQDSDEFSISVGTHAPLVNESAPFQWPGREYLEAVSTLDWTTEPQERILAWSRGAVADLCMETGRDPGFFASMTQSDTMAQLAREVWQLLMEQRLIKRRPDLVESEYDDTISSFSAGGYSESKPGLKDRNPIFARMANSSPEIARKMYHLMTQAKKDEISAMSGELVPAEFVQEVNWYSGLYGDPLFGHNSYGGWW